MPASSLLARAASPLELPTYEGSGQCVHPDVIRIAGAFYGQEFLMAMEPYPFADEYFENPSLLGSDNGHDWRVPAGVVNPIVAPPKQRGSWNSDADLLLGRELQLFLYYRHNSGSGETTLLRAMTLDGTRWNAPERICTVAVSGTFASPALVTVDDRYHMYYVDTLETTVKLTTSRDGKNWEAERTLFAFNAAWHIDATRSGDWVYLLLNDKRALFLLRSRDQRRWSILHGDRWRDYPHAGWDETSRLMPLLTPSANSWDNECVYRSSLLVENGLIRLWYGAKSTGNAWRVGYTDGPIHE